MNSAPTLPAKFWSLKSAVEQITKCEFTSECEGGVLAMNDAFIWLKAAAKVGPEFLPGQGVWFEVEAEAAGKRLKQWVFFYVVGCFMDSGTDDRYWTYSLSCDPPAPYHYGTTHFSGVRAEKLRLYDPSAQRTAAPQVGTVPRDAAGGEVQISEAQQIGTEGEKV